MRILEARPLTAEAFAPFGTVHRAPDEPGRRYDDPAVGWRHGLAPSLSFARIPPTPGAELVVRALERHPRTAQTFLPLEVGRFLVVVAPAAADGTPDTARARAFLGGPGLAVTYAAGTWHQAMTVLDRPAAMAILMGRDATPADDEILEVPPFAVRVEP